MTEVLKLLGISRSTRYWKPKCGPRGRPAMPVDPQLRTAAERCARQCPWRGCKRIAAVCRRAGLKASDRAVCRVMRDAKQLQRRVVREAESCQAAKLFEPLPLKPSELWQSDITWVHVPGFGWWYAVTVTGYYSRCLLAHRLSGGHTAADAEAASDMACQQAERMPTLVSDNGPSFMSRSFRIHAKGRFSHVRIAYRTPTQSGLLERFHQTLKTEEAYWRRHGDPGAARRCLEEFRERCNETRPHWALKPAGGGDALVPSEVYADRLAVKIPSWQGWAKAAKKKLGQVSEDGDLPPFEPTESLDSVA